MYYDKKSTFYVKQYGPAVLVIVISILLLAGGAYVYFKTSKPSDPNEIVNNASNSASNSNNDYNIADNSSIFNNLATGELSKEYKVLDVKDTSTIVIEVEKNKATEIKLIGVRITTPETRGNNSLQETLDKMKNDLINKNIKLSFDTNKAENNNLYAYVYINDQLYNETALKEGFAELRPEKYNISKLDILLNAEKAAKSNDAGIWQ